MIRIGNKQDSKEFEQALYRDTIFFKLSLILINVYIYICLNPLLSRFLKLMSIYNNKKFRKINKSMKNEHENERHK